MAGDGGGRVGEGLRERGGQGRVCEEARARVTERITDKMMRVTQVTCVDEFNSLA